MDILADLLVKKILKILDKIQFEYDVYKFKVVYYV